MATGNAMLTGKNDALDVAELDNGVQQPPVEFLMSVDDIYFGQARHVGDVELDFVCRTKRNAEQSVTRKHFHDIFSD